MYRFRPSYEFTKIATDYEFFDYIKLAYQDYLIGIRLRKRNIMILMLRIRA